MPSDGLELVRVGETSGDEISRVQTDNKLFVKVIRVRNLPKPIIWSNKYYVELMLDGEDLKKKTNATKGTREVEWEQGFFFDCTDVSELLLEVYRKRWYWRDKRMGGFHERVSSMLDSVSNGVVTRSLNLSRVPSHIELQMLSSVDLTPEALSGIESDLKQLQTIISPSKSTPNSLQRFLPWGAEQGQDDSTWNRFSRRVRSFIELVDGIAEVHPYARLVWGIISVVPRMIFQQIERDETVASLLETMSDTYSFVDESQVLQFIPTLCDTLKRIAQQTVECCDFLRRYSKDPGFWKRTLSNLAGGVDAQIKEYEAKFRALKEKFNGRILVSIQVYVLRFLTNMNIIFSDVNLNDMPYATGARFRKDKCCLPGTREEFMDKIIKWAYDPDDSRRLCLLLGHAGSGKSAIAHTMSQRFHELERLGSSFCFDENYADERRPDVVFCTIARDIADRDPCFRRALAYIIRSKSLRTTQDITTQFESFILEPMKQLTSVGPIFVVIDALDESGKTRKQRHALVNILLKRLSELPANFRVLITSRPEVDVLEYDEQTTYVLRMDDIPVPQTNRDILAYVKHQLTDPSKRQLVISEKSCRQLAKKAEGLFQWAFVACDYIKDRRGGSTHKKRFLKVLEASATDATESLDRIYTAVLKQNFKPEESEEIALFKSVMGQILATFEPISVNTLTELRDSTQPAGTMENDRESISSLASVPSVVQYMGSLLSGVDDPSVPLRSLHTSFRDFLTSKERGQHFYVDAIHHPTLAFACLRVMNSALRFNICDLETSYKRNKDMHDLEQRVQKNIPPQLSYACRFWAEHLRLSPYDERLREELESLLFKNLIFWFEVLSLLQAIGRAAPSLTSVLEWIQKGQVDGSDIYDMTNDAQNFVRRFGAPISQSAAHTYVSALSLTPENTLMFRTYGPRLTEKVVRIISAHAPSWPQCQSLLVGHIEKVTAVVFSPDGQRVISGSYDLEVRVWNAETGAPVCAPLRGHTERITSVAATLDGKYMASGSADQTVIIWDAEIFEVAYGPFGKHTGIINSVAYSPDGVRLASGSDDCTVHLWTWDAQHDVAVFHSKLEGHTGAVYSVQFSKDGRHLVTGAQDQSVRVWDAEIGTTTSVLQGHEGAVLSVAFSPDSRSLVSGSADHTIRIWEGFNDNNKNPTCAVLRGHTDTVASVTFSPNGRYVVSGSHDSSIRKWDVNERQNGIHTVLEGHVRKVQSVAFSQDGRRISSGSDDWMVRIWNADSGEASPAPYPGHTDSIFCVRYSPDGKYVASASFDRTIRLWNTQTGKPMGDPLVGHAHVVLSLSFSGDGRHIVSGSLDKTLRLWDVNTRECTKVYQGHSGEVLTVLFSPNGRWIVSGSEDKTLRIWDTQSGETVHELSNGHTGPVRALAFSPDSKIFASGSYDQTICVWNVETGAMAGTPLKGHTDRVVALKFTHDGKRIVSGSNDQTIRVWDVNACQQIGEPMWGHNGYVITVALSPDGKRLVTGGSDHTIRMWDMDSRIAVGAALRGNADWVQSVAYSPDGQQVVVGASDRTIRFCEPSIWSQFEDETRRMQPVLFSRDHAHALTNVKNLLDTNNRLDCRSLFGMDMDGWVLGPHEELLLWIPHEHRQLCHPWHTIVIGREITELDLSKFAHGPEWVECFNTSHGH